MQWFGRISLALMAILLLGTGSFAASPSSAPTPQIAGISGALPEGASYRVFPTYVLISSGVGNEHWEMKYGFHRWNASDPAPVTFAGDGHWIYFANSQWLRLIDARTGTVVQRWSFGKKIANIEPQPGSYKLALTLDDTTLSSLPDPNPAKISFDLDAPTVPAWGQQRFVLARTALDEPFLEPPAVVDYQRPMPCEPAKAILPGVTEMIRRDPLSPWFRFVRAKILQDCNDPEAHTAFEDALRVAHPDFHDFFWLSRDLDDAAEPELSAKAFEMAYADFIRKGFEPRMLYPLFERLMLYPNSLAAAERAKSGGWSPQQAADAERLYRVGPYVEWSEVAWNAIANHIPPDQGGLWRERADETKMSAMADESWIYRPLDIAIYIVLGGGLAVYLYLVIAYIRLWPRLRMRVQSMSGASLGQRFSWLGLPYWTTGQRACFLLLVALVWLAGGIATLHTKILLRLANAPMSFFSGTLADPASRAYLDQLAPTNARDLLKAIALQQNGDGSEAEAIYRALPQYRESWNNLGVLLAKEGKPDEAQKAFQKALKLDPTFSEAMLNLGMPASDFWTEQYHKITSAPMLAPPSHAIVLRALVGSRRAVLSTILKGPDPLVERDFSGPGTAITMQRIFIYLPLVIVVFFVVTRPKPLPDLASNDVPPTKAQIVVDALIPGISPAWSWLSATVLGAWICLLLCLFNHGTLIVQTLAMPSIWRAFNLPAQWFPAYPQLQLWPVYLAAILLWLANLGLVLLKYRQQRSGAPSGSAGASA